MKKEVNVRRLHLHKSVSRLSLCFSCPMPSAPFHHVKSTSSTPPVLPLLCPPAATFSLHPRSCPHTSRLPDRPTLALQQGALL
jgi:hypothetical protein